MSDSESVTFWETDEAVERFAARDPDRRMVAMLDDFADPAQVRVLDLGCAAGRNTVVLAQAGFDVWAVDSSSAMVEHTRARIADLLGEEEAARRVQAGRMQDLSAFPSAHFDLVVALGILHQADTRSEWEDAIREVSRVLSDGGQLLLAAWSPQSRPAGVPLERVPGEEGVYLGFHSGRHFLLDLEAYDEWLGRQGLIPAAPTEEVRVETEGGARVTINGLYRRVVS